MIAGNVKKKVYKWLQNRQSHETDKSAACVSPVASQQCSHDNSLKLGIRKTFRDEHFTVSGWEVTLVEECSGSCRMMVVLVGMSWSGLLGVARPRDVHCDADHVARWINPDPRPEETGQRATSARASAMQAAWSALWHHYPFRGLSVWKLLWDSRLDCSKLPRHRVARSLRGLPVAVGIDGGRTRWRGILSFLSFDSIRQKHPSVETVVI